MREYHIKRTDVIKGKTKILKNTLDNRELAEDYCRMANSMFKNFYEFEIVEENQSVN